MEGGVLNFFFPSVFIRCRIFMSCLFCYFADKYLDAKIKSVFSSSQTFPNVGDAVCVNGFTAFMI